MNAQEYKRFGLLKTKMDAHTMGIDAASSLLRECGYEVMIAPSQIEEALGKLQVESNKEIVVKWIRDNRIRHIGISYRLDPIDGVNIVGRIVSLLKREALFGTVGALVQSIYFAGLKTACDMIDREYGGMIRTFRGGESAEETLLAMGVPLENIPHTIIEGCRYDKELIEFGKEVVEQIPYAEIKPFNRVKYPEFGTASDTLIKRLDYNFVGGFQPLIRAHSGPYSSELTREQCIEQYLLWCKELAEAGFLDILSIGSSQLSQSNFGENWAGKTNGGGVPVNSEEEYHDIYEAARPMLVRTYSGTKNVEYLAAVYERTMNISWHAFSLWWFDELDGRGPNTLYDNLREHISAMRYVALTGKPVETNVPHHFAFRGCDDITYIVSAYVAAKMAKLCGVRTFILQNMLNTPRSTWGIQDLAKSRAMLHMIQELQDEEFRVVFQTRAGLDYFKPDIEQAKVQLAAVTAMMDDIVPYDAMNPEIIHVVSYSEALYLATPSVLNDSIKITRAALAEYRRRKAKGCTPDVMTDDITRRTLYLEQSARSVVTAMEDNIKNLYSPEGLYLSFVAGWLPVPTLWSDSPEFVYAKNWKTQMRGGGMELMEDGLLMSVDSRINSCVQNISEAEYIMKNKYGVSL